MHMVPVAVLPEPSEEESIMGVRVSDVGRGDDSISHPTTMPQEV